MRGAVAVGALVLVLSGCSGPGEPQVGAPTASEPATPSTSAAGTTASASPTPQPPSPTSAAPSEPAPSEPAPHPVSLPALFDKKYDGRGLRLGEVVVRTDAYTQYAVTYRGDGLAISGQMLLPEGRGPFPVLVLAHGYIDPAVYVSGQGLRREQDRLARAGYAVVHVDYRNHAGSDVDPRAEEQLRLGYTVDVINAVRAIRRSGDPRLDTDRVGLLGRSMGGGVVYNVLTVRPGLVDAAVVFAPVSSLAADNFNRWVRGDPGRSGVSRRILRAYGAPERNREFWRQASPRPYFDRVTEPVLIHHGTADESCPIRWSRQTQEALRRAGVRSRLVVYPGEPHAFAAAWPASMTRTERFFEAHLG